MKRLHPTRADAIRRARKRGLSDAQVAIINALDEWFDEFPNGPSLHEIMELTGLSYGVIWTALPVLEHCGYVLINRDRKGRQLHRGVILMCGLDDED